MPGHATDLADLMTVQDTALLLGVSVPTLQSDDAGKSPQKRHPMNGYRLCARDAVLQSRREILEGRTA